jgi:hypothetical protein
MRPEFKELLLVGIAFVAFSAGMYYGFEWIAAPVATFFAWIVASLNTLTEGET